MNADELKRYFPNASASTVKANCADGASSCAVPEQVVCHEPMAATARKDCYSPRVLVRIESFRRRLLDPDNLYGGCKYHIDSLRYAGIVSNDTEGDIELKISQTQVKHAKEEVTVVTIEPL